MKIALAKTEYKETFGEGENSFDYYFRPLTVEEKAIINSHIVWKKDKNRMVLDLKNTDVSELPRMAITRIDRLYDGNDGKVDTIQKLLDTPFEPGTADGILLSMWTNIWIAQTLPEELKKKLSPDSTQA